MSVMPTPPAPADPLSVLREYGPLAPWGLRDLAALATAILDASGIVPINAASRAQPSERTIRFYVARGLVSPPEGRGTAAVYTYKHLLQVLAIKLRQMEGATLSACRPRGLWRTCRQGCAMCCNGTFSVSRRKPPPPRRSG
jgi:hypothetical protein